ncbi:MAG: antibiotic biosynthesis monooxygenase [Verrucomicrobiota bacterium]
MIASTPEPPYYAVIFTSALSPDPEGYEETAQRMVDLAGDQPGFLGIESAREELGITVSYWSDLDAIRQWRENLEHRAAQQKGRDTWYARYKLRIAYVERDYGSVEPSHSGE